MTSKFTEQIASEGYICPYCEETHYCDDWGHDYDGEVVECEECGKKFRATASHSVDFYARPDCELNGGEHDYVWNEAGAYFCSVCNHCKLKEDM